MKELQDLIAAWRAIPPGGRAVLATVVATTGSTYRKPGARMLITEAGWAAGSVSGGCLESDVLSTAWDRTSNGPAIALYDSRADDDIVWGFGLGCQGSVTVLFERLGADGGPLPFLASCIEARQPGLLATNITEGPSLGQRQELPPTNDSREQGTKDGVFYEPILPPLAFTIFGAGHDAIPLATAAHALGWFVTVVDHRAAFADPARFPGVRVLQANPDEIDIEPLSAVVNMTHSYERDLELLRKLLPMNLLYIGQLGPRVRTERMLSALADDGFTPSAEALDHLYSPVGLDLGSETPEEIAIAIVGEIQAILRGREGSSLRLKVGPLHEGARCQASR